METFLAILCEKGNRVVDTPFAKLYCPQNVYPYNIGIRYGVLYNPCPPIKSIAQNISFCKR